MKITIKKNILQFCLPAMSKDKMRYNLQGIHISYRNGAIEAVAMDGIVLLAARDPNVEVERFDPFVLNMPESKDFMRHLRAAKADKVELSWEDLSDRPIMWRVIGTRGEELGRGIITTIEDDFPQWRHLVPKELKAYLDKKFIGSEPLKQLIEANKVIEGSKGFRITQTERSPNVVLFGDENYFGIVMPLDPKEPYIMPSWV